ncbi:MAG TPA: hypothetical protein VGE10_06730 [Zeimonas sp.]
MKMTGLDGVLDTLRKLPPEVVSKKGGPVLRSLRKGASVLVKQARENFHAEALDPGKSGINQITGFTEKAIVARRRAPPPGERGERVVVTVLPRTHPGGRQYRGRTIKANDIAFIMEVGSSTQPAAPWLRPAYAAKKGEAMRVIEKTLVGDVNRIVARLSKGK